MRARTLTDEPIALGPYRLPRDPAVDKATLRDRAAIGIDENPYPPVVLGTQVEGPGLDHTGGRPTRSRTDAVTVSSYRTPGSRPSIAPGTIRRNVNWPRNGIDLTIFNPAANRFEQPAPVDLGELRLPQSDYVIDSRFRQQVDSLATVVSGSRKPHPGLGRTYSTPSIMAGQATGWPVIAPQVPSFGSRVPLRRPRSLAGGKPPAPHATPPPPKKAQVKKR